ncbi:hypothetical protein AgCh_036288 [Apium graveolens]
MEVNYGLKTVECLRGRLLAERGASRVAHQEAHQLAQKLIELENQLRREIKSRNRAEEKLKSLIKKLESINISSSASDGSLLSNYSSSVLDKSSESSSVSSSTASYLYTKCVEDDEDPNRNTQTTHSAKPRTEELMKEKDSPLSEILMHNETTIGATKSSVVLPSKEHIESDKAISQKSHDFDSTKELNDTRSDDRSYVKPTCRVH